MGKKDYKLIDISESVAIPVPLGLTPKEEAEIVAQYKAQVDPGELEKMAEDYKELMKQQEQGELISLEQLLKEIEIDRLEEKESA